MTNPYKGYEYQMHPEDYLPGAEQIAPTDPATLKGLMEVWRDTANQLNAEKLLAEKSHQNYTSVHEKYLSEMEEKLKLKEEVKKEKELKDLAIQELNGFREQYKEQKEHLEKVRRHRDELAEKVGQTRATRTALDGFLEAFDDGDDTLEPIDILRDIAERLERDLGDGDE